MVDRRRDKYLDPIEVIVLNAEAFVTPPVAPPPVPAVRTETHYLKLKVDKVKLYVAAREALGWRTVVIVRDSSKKWLVVFEIDL